jgi:hypothetical protein
VAQCSTLSRREGGRRGGGRRRNMTVDNDTVSDYYYHHLHHYSKFIFKVNCLLLYTRTAPHSVFKILVFHPR